MPNTPPAGQVTLRDLLTPLFRYRRTFFLTLIPVFALTMGFLFLQKPLYEARMTMLVSRERLHPTAGTDAPNTGQPDTPISEEEINSESELVRSQDVLRQVVHANGLEKSKPSLFSKKPSESPEENAQVDRAVRRLSKDLQVKVVPKSNIIQVSYASTDPKLTYNVLTSLGDFYMQKHVAVHRTPGMYSFLDKETQRYQSAMNQDDALLREFEQGQGIAAPELQQQGMAEQVTSAIGRRNEVEEAIASDMSRIRADQHILETTPVRSATVHATAPPSMLLQQLGTDLLKARTKRTELAAKYQSDYPLVKEADQEVALAQEAYDRANGTQYVSDSTDRDTTYEVVRQDLAKTQADLAAQTASLAAMNRSIESLKGQMVTLDQATLKEKALQREAKTDQDNYLLYLSKREQQRASDALDQGKVGNVAIATPPAIPAVPESSSIPAPLIAFGVALVLALALTYLRAYLDPSFHSPTEVSESLGVPYVVSVSKKTA